VELEGDVLRVTFDPDSLEALFLDDPVVEAVLHAPAAEVARMREALTRILAYGRSDAHPIVVGFLSYGRRSGRLRAVRTLPPPGQAPQ
jgi:hypothetical protein